MNHQSVFREFSKYVSLNILGQMAFSCYTLADTFFVSAKLGANGLTALNLAFPIFCLISGTGLMLGIGGGTKYSIYKSRNEETQANRVFTNAVYLVIAFATLFFFTGLFFSETLVRLLGADDTVFEITNTYLKVMMLFAPAFLTNHLLQCFVRNDGKPSLSMAAMITGSFSNVVLDYIFIFPLDMGIFGAILATGLAPIISIIVLSPYLIKRNNKFHFIKSAPFKKYIGEIISSGSSPFLTEATSGIVMFLFNFIILGISGNIGVAAFSVITVVSLVVVALYTGLSQGIQPILSRNYGAGNVNAVKSILKYAIITMLLLSTIIYSIIYFCAPTITAVFNSEGNTVLADYAIYGLKLYFTACPFIGCNIVLATYLISTEKPFLAQIISLLRGFIVLVPVAFLLSSILEMTGVWCAYPMTELLVAVVAIVLYKKSNNIHLS